MRGALLEELGGVPHPADLPEPVGAPGDIEIEVHAVALNPVDVAVGAGVFHAGHPPLPYSPAIEAVGRRTDTGSLVYVTGSSRGISRPGTLVATLTAAESDLTAIPDDADAAAAAALGTAGLAGWLPIRWLADVRPGESVLVLGATGTAGSIAVQAARLAGAGRVIAAGRDAAALAALGDVSDATVDLTGEGLAERLASACDDGVDVIFDPLWGEPLATALTVTRPGARISHVGAAAGPTATLPSSLVRGRQLRILGYSNFAVPRDIVNAAYTEMVERSIDGSLTISVERSSIDDIAAAWARLRAGGSKQVVMFPASGGAS